MRVAMVTPRYEKDIRGGGEKSCKLLVDTLRTLGINVDVITGDELFPKIQDTMLLNLVMYKYLKKLTNKYDIFHTYNMSFLPTIGLLTKKYTIKSVATLNGHVFSPTFELQFSDHPARNYKKCKFLLKNQIKYITKFTVLGEFWKDTWIKDGIPKEKIQVIPNMIAKNYVSLKTKHRATVNILVVGNYAKWRDLDILLEAYTKLPLQDIILHIVGQGWKETILKYKGKNILVYHSQVAHQELKDMYAKADIFVQSYKYNGIGRTMLEAAQNKTAIVTTGRLQDFPYLHGYLNYFANSDMLCLTLQTLINNKGLRESQGEDVCKIVNSFFAPENIASKYVEIYKEILKC
jgi:glycosyltransferase involved in cell wall biosynthesis